MTTWGNPSQELTESDNGLNKTSGNQLYDYAYKLWSGLISDYYMRRWDTFFTAILEKWGDSFEVQRDYADQQAKAVEVRYYEWILSKSKKSVNDTFGIARHYQGRMKGDVWGVLETDLRKEVHSKFGRLGEKRTGQGTFLSFARDIHDLVVSQIK